MGIHKSHLWTNLQSPGPANKGAEREKLHVEDSVSVDVDDLGVSLLSDPLLIRPIKVYVSVQPQGWFMPVDEVYKGLEAYVGHIILVPEAERRGVGREDPGLGTADKAPATDSDRECPRPAAHVALGILVGTARVKRRPREPREYHTAAFALRLHNPTVKRRAATGVLGAFGAWIVVSKHVVETATEKGDDVFEVIERQVPAGNHRFDSPGIGGKVRTVQHPLHLVADAEDLHVYLPVTLQSIPFFAGDPRSSTRTVTGPRHRVGPGGPDAGYDSLPLGARTNIMHPATIRRNLSMRRIRRRYEPWQDQRPRS